MLSSFFILSSKGSVLIKERYRNDISEDMCKPIISAVIRSKIGANPPNIVMNGIYCYSILRDKLTYLIMSKTEFPTLTAVQFLDSFYSLLRNFCGGATEDHITKNILLVYELMTECVDNGLIKITSTEQIRHTIYSDPVLVKHNAACEVYKPGPFGLEKVIGNAASERPMVKSRSQQALRSPEVFLDVIESLTAHFNKDGQIQRFYLHGTIQLKSFIPHSHRLIVSLEDNLKQEPLKGLHLDEIKFDTSVDASNFEKNRSFVVHPSQGEVKAMVYSLENPVLLPFRLTANIQPSEQNKDCDLTLKLTCNLPVGVEALDVTLNIPVSSNTRNVMQQFSKFDNSAEFIRKERKIVWKLKKFPGQEEVVAKFKLVDALQCSANLLELGPVSLDFEASNATCSGLKVRNARAEDPSGRPVPIQKWVRYISLAHSYGFRIATIADP